MVERINLAWFTSANLRLHILNLLIKPIRLSRWMIQFYAGVFWGVNAPLRKIPAAGAPVYLWIILIIGGNTWAKTFLHNTTEPVFSSHLTTQSTPSIPCCASTSLFLQDHRLLTGVCSDSLVVWLWDEPSGLASTKDSVWQPRSRDSMLFHILI